MLQKPGRTGHGIRRRTLSYEDRILLSSLLSLSEKNRWQFVSKSLMLGNVDKQPFNF